jgi:glucose-1-phosphate cytidylyltransferase
MMPVYGKPILVRIMELFASQGHRDFVLSVGYRKEVIIDYFDGRRMDWRLEIVDTGDDADTGERIRRCRHLLTEPFFATYGDGLSDVDLGALLAFHKGHGRLATVTSFPLVSQYGTLESDANGRVLDFREKPRLAGHWINAGFFVMQPGVFDAWAGNNLERDVLPTLLRRGELYTYRHEGFFKSMDTQKDQQELDDMFSRGAVPHPAAVTHSDDAAARVARDSA